MILVTARVIWEAEGLYSCVVRGVCLYRAQVSTLEVVVNLMQFEGALMIVFLLLCG